MVVSVLLVEDDELVRCVMAELLRDEGFEVYEAHDGDFAASFINTQPALDVLLTDVNMPGVMDGRDLADHARSVVACMIHSLINVVVYDKSMSWG